MVPDHPNHRLTALRLSASLCRHGLDADQLLAQAGISATLAQNPLDCVNTEQMVAFFKAAKMSLNDDFFGLMQQKFKPGTIHYMFELGLRADTLEALIAHCARFVDQLVDGLCVNLVRRSDTVALCLKLQHPECDPEHLLVDQMLLYWHRVLSWAVDYQIPVTRLDLTMDEAPNAQRLCYWVCKSWLPGHSVCSIHFDIRYLSLPVVRTPKEWLEHGLHQANGLPELPDGGQGWSHRLRALLQSDLKQSHPLSSLLEAAQVLGLGARSLRRYLENEGSSYQQVLDQLLHDTAIEKLHVQRLSVAEVAEQLGFAEPRSFSRAFKRWTGVSPTRYSL